MSYKKQDFQSGQKLMASQMNHIEDGIEALDIQIHSGVLGTSDYIVEQGTSGIWTYRKWYSGIAECWGTSEASNASGFATCTLPFEFIDSDYTVSATPIYGGTTNPTIDVSVGKSSASFVVYTRNNATTDLITGVCAMLHVVGKWKEVTDIPVSIGTTGAIDYIVEQGTSGIWTYRKWYSGIAECWGNTVAQTVAMTTLWGTKDFYCNDSAFPQIDYPFAFTQLPTVTVSPIATDYGYWMYALSADETTTATKKYGVGRPTSAASATVQAAYHVVGRWK
jgi:hypothetical protein